MRPNLSTNTRSDRSFRLFRLFDIDVRLHWLWFLVAIWQFQNRGYQSPVFGAIEYLALFGMVLMHEFGHALACRQVGGEAHEIVLWPLGGVAYVSPPPRPGALLWAIAAGPLVNVALIPVIYLVGHGVDALNLAALPEDGYRLLGHLSVINYALLIFNLLPIYPLDGGQILRALLWYWLGEARSLKVASILGLVGAAGLVAVAIWAQSLWIGVIALYMGVRCWSSFKMAGALSIRESAPKRTGFACPACNASPAEGAWWVCSACGLQFDTFEHNAVCPNCGTLHSLTGCRTCRAQNPFEAWRSPEPLL